MEVLSKGIRIIDNMNSKEKRTKRNVILNQRLDQPQGIPIIPAVIATASDLNDFKGFIAKHTGHLEKYGALKIILPQCFNPVADGFKFTSDESDTFCVSFYEMLKSRGLNNGRIYVSKKDESKEMTLREYYRKAKQMERHFEKLSMEEKESQILNMRIKHTMYAPDVDFNVLNKDYSGFNLHKLPNLLDNYVKDYGHVWGVTSPLSYIGSFGSRFAWHVEDMNLYSISIMLFGDPKLWYTIPNKDGPKFEALQEKHKMWPAQPCNHPLRHKTNCFDPYFVKSNGIEVFKIIHEPMQMVITAPGSYHSGMNLGFNFATAVNFAFDQWEPEGRKFETCTCQRPEDIFLCNVDQILRSNESLPFKKRISSALKCIKCKKVFRTNSSLNFHTKNAHTDKMFLCKICKDYRYFKFSKNLAVHMNDAHGKTITAKQMQPAMVPKKNDAPKAYACDQCTSAFGANWLLTQHKNLVHSKQSFKCKMCNFVSKYKKNLKRHAIKNIH